MSEQNRNEEVVREVWERWNSGDRSIPEDLIHPKMEVYSALTDRVYRGADEVREWISEIDDQFEDWDLSLGRFQDLGAERMLVTGGIHGRGRGSGIDLDQPAAWIVTIRDGRLATIRNYIGADSAERARADAGA